MSAATLTSTAVFRPIGYGDVFVSLSLTGAVKLFTEARCPCGHRMMLTPGAAIVEVRKVSSNAASTGRGRVIQCSSCRSLCEVVEHAATR